MIRAAWFLALMACAFPAMAGTTEERGMVLLTGNVWADGARKTIEGRAMVCNLRSRDSFLSLRVQPDSRAAEIAKLNEMAITTLTGETRGKWAKVQDIVVEVAQDGEFLPQENRGAMNLAGWVHTDYLCNYLY